MKLSNTPSCSIGFSLTLSMHNQQVQTIPYNRKREIFDIFEIRKIAWYGDEEQMSFLGRLFDLNKLPSHDYRYHTAFEDIRQHTHNNHDWEDDWIANDNRFKLLSGSDETFLNFLVLTLHPRVRSNPSEHDILYSDITTALTPFGWQLREVRSIGGRKVYEIAKMATGTHVISDAKSLAKRLDAPHFHKEIDRINRSISSDLGQAIGASKDLLETACLTILKERNEPMPPKDDLQKLVKAVTKTMKLTPDDIDVHKKGAKALRRLLSSLPNIVQGLAELRNEYGAGHGKVGDHQELDRPNALFMVQTSLTLVTYLVEVHVDLLSASK